MEECARARVLEIQKELRVLKGKMGVVKKNQNLGDFLIQMCRSWSLRQRDLGAQGPGGDVLRSSIQHGVASCIHFLCAGLDERWQFPDWVNFFRRGLCNLRASAYTPSMKRLD